MFFFPVLWLHHLNDNLKTAHLDISYLQRIAKLWGHLIIKKKMNLKESVVKAFITKWIDCEI